MANENTNAAVAAEAINNSTDMKIEIRIEAADAANTKASFSLNECGKYEAKSDNDLLVVNCDLEGDENENPTFVNLLRDLSGFYVKEAQRLLKTFITYTVGGRTIDAEVIVFTPFPKFCSFIATCKNVEIK